MKFSTVLLVGSLGLNAALMALLVVNAAGDSAPAPAARPAAATAATPPPRAAEIAPGAETWAALKSEDLAVLRDRLRTEGFPPSMIRAILAAQIREGTAARRRALEAAQASLPLWKNAVVDPKTQAELRALEIQERRTLKDLLGPDPDSSYALQLRRQVPGLAPEKIDQIAAIREHYDEQRINAYNQTRNAPTPEEQEKILAFDKAMRAEIVALLSPQELEDYDLRTSGVTNSLRYNLAAFNPTETEFRTLYRLQTELQAKYQEQLRTVSNLPPAELRNARVDMQNKNNDDIAAALGPERYAEYQRSTDSNYRTTTQLVARLALPPDTANQLYAVQQSIQPRVTALNQDRALPADARNQQLAALQAEAVAKLTPILGSAQNLDAYKQYGGSWLQTLQPRPPPPRP
jgi:hypothetical protein